MEIIQEIIVQDLSKIVATKRFAQEVFVNVPWEEDKVHGVESTQDVLRQDINGEIGQAHHDKACSLDNNIVVVFQNGRMVNDKVEELMLGLEEEQQQSHDDDHRISSAVARGMLQLIPLSTTAAATTTVLQLSVVQKLALTSQSPLHL